MRTRRHKKRNSWTPIPDPYDVDEDDPTEYDPILLPPVEAAKRKRRTTWM